MKLKRYGGDWRLARSLEHLIFLRGANFSISNINNDSLEITTRNGSIVEISKNAFVDVVHYLNNNNHNQNNQCQIKSSNNPEIAGPLCRISRQYNNNVRCINYILPILAEYGIVGIGPNRPNKTWLL
jgi:hypothetical protein